MRRIDIKGIGIVRPNKEVLSSTIDKEYNFKEGYTQSITGLEKRYFFKNFEDMNSSILKCIDEAINMADICLDEIDCIINASATMNQAIPYNASYTHKILNLSKSIASFDINMTCLSVLRAFDVASHLFQSYKNILIVSADYTSIGLDWRDIQSAGIFGDGATAMIVSSSNTGGILFSNFETHSKAYEYCQIKAGGSKYPPQNYEKDDFLKLSNFEMNGKKLFKISSKILPSFIFDTLKLNDMSIDDIDYIVPHQASGTSLKHIIKILGIDSSKVVDIFKSHANQVSSSIPSALYTLLKSKKIQSKDKIMIVGTSAGLGLGLVLWEVP